MSEPSLDDPVPKKSVWERVTRVYCGLAAFGSVLSLVDDGRLWPLTVFDALLHALLLPAPIFAALALSRRHWKLAAGFSIATGYLLWSCGSWVSASPPLADSPGTESLVVLTWNLGLMSCDAEKVAEEIRRLEPDVVLLQEARADRAEAVFESLSDLFPYCEHFEYGLFSKAFLSRSEPVSAELVTPEDSKNFLELTIPFDGSVVTITSMHTNKAFAFFGRKWFGYQRMLEQIKLAAARPTNLVLGDFNLTERNAVYREIRGTGLVDSYRERHSDPGFTFPAFGRYRHLPLPPLLRLDYIWHTPDLRCTSIERTHHADSDHRGLVARITRR